MLIETKLIKKAETAGILGIILMEEFLSEATKKC